MMTARKVWYSKYSNEIKGFRIAHTTTIADEITERPY